MKIKKIIIFSIIILTILLCIAFTALYKNMAKSKDDIPDVFRDSYNTQNNTNNTTNQEYDKSIYYENEGKLYTTSGEPADGIDFEFRGVPEEVTKYISDIESFYNTVKVYVFSYGLNENAKIATYSRFEFDIKTNRLAIAFILDDTKKTQMVVILNLDTNIVEVSFK